MHFSKHAILLFAALVVMSGCSSDDSSSQDTAGPNPGTTPEPTPGGTPSGTPGGTPGAGSDPLALAPLPNPPLTEGPSANDEPVTQASIFHTVTSFPVVRDTSPRVPLELTPEFTEADFAQGLPPAVVTVPSGLDTSQNGAPFFEGLANVRVEAGELVEIRYVPRDPEGDLPGMFPQELPEGASFDDNFDGTKTLRWQTYQADVGVNDFTVVAVDPAVGAYRSSQTVFIAVDEPSDPSSVPNVAPNIEPVDDYTVRVGDPAVIYLVGTDRNGTNPSIELLNAPSGTTLTPDERDPELLQWLQVTPMSAGPVTIDLLIRDADDPNLTGTAQINLFARPAADFVRAGARLRDAAAGGSVLFGSAVSPVFYLQADGGVYESIAASEFSIITPESSMKWDAINPAPGLFEFADMDNLIQFANVNAMQVRGHPLVWHRSLPSWVEDTTSGDREVHMREYITRVMNRYADQVDYWDVINEPLNDNDGNMRQSIWYEAMGENYIDIAFQQARELDPTAKLVLNEFDVGFSGPKFDGLLQLVDRLLERDVPVDAIGFQMHVFSSFDQFDELAANMAAIAERGLDIHITELDVALTGSDNESVQAAVYGGVVQACQAQPRCTVLQTWGFTDRYSFRTLSSPLYLDENYGVKPAYSALQQTLAGN